ncbi:translational GTPase TypA [Candidatus Lucifugimonas marina]|uniref:Large ribosomal subunit assembly factor BipA n=1 Tax=Candidatus Lucifugimonas marina TaxID=3038979 RepID=A0AAJ6CU18_9CHLR|nr:translational GTPase TypA [SAR202 cluster bacterium JH702]MDG0870188.1 translational GTPase TypA [SAR202 cluster bacterium JH639]WFG36245.1 translational GTPase TypA [SAR202 cluster bacterium JH545]WFG40192.1 translational GTPase TypA [SAR202 cluster bacterium JH1073]
MTKTLRNDRRNVAIIAHVDHGKTTLVDAMLKQSGSVASHKELDERVMDNTDLEKEKGITILAKNTAVRWGETKINIIDTPGHADFGGEVERGLAMVDGVLLLVDASEGPLPQTRFVLRKALEANLSVILVINKIDRPDARISEVIDEVYELFIDLDATEEQIDFPIIYAVARDGIATMDLDQPGTDLKPMFELILENISAPSYEEGHPLQAHVTNLDASPYLGRLAICRVHQGTIKKDQIISHCRVDGSIVQSKITELYITEGLERITADEASAGEIIAVAGMPDITIGETIADFEDPRPLPTIRIDEPSLSATIGINTSPLTGLDGKKLTARMIKDRLESELIGNVSINVLPSDRPDSWIFQGRGELQLAVLVETMRREGFEMTVGKPEVVTKMVDGKLHEPMERLAVDINEEHLGAVTQMLAHRKGKMVNMVNHGQGRVRMDFIIPARGLIGFHNEFVVETRGAGLAHHVFEGYERWQGEMRSRPTGSLVSDRRGVTTTYSLLSAQERGQLFVPVGAEVYEGMIVGENPRPQDMDLNVVKAKKQTNMRSAGADHAQHLDAHKQLSLEEALEFMMDDECLEVTPNFVRVRKTILDQNKRGRAKSSKKLAAV